jgi:hypothetical protein
MTHTPRKTATTRARTSAGQSAHVGIALAFPELCQQRPAIAEPLELLRQAAWQEWSGNTPTLGSGRLLGCADRVFVELQALLHAYPGSHLPGSLRREVWDAQGLAPLALPDRLGELKRLQLAAGSGRPLTVCFGRRARKLPLQAPYDRVAYPTGDGCGLVHPDSTGLRRPNFRYRCPRCRDRLTVLAEQALTHAQAASEGRFLYLVFDKRGQRFPAWVGPCSNCGLEFVNPKAQVRRCEVCRHGHRGPQKENAPPNPSAK